MNYKEEVFEFLKSKESIKKYNNIILICAEDIIKLIKKYDNATDKDIEEARMAK